MKNNTERSVYPRLILALLTLFYGINLNVIPIYVENYPLSAKGDRSLLLYRCFINVKEVYCRLGCAAVINRYVLKNKSGIRKRYRSVCNGRRH